MTINLLQTPLSQISFDDVVAFCKEQHGEGIQLDYKLELPPKGLAKHFASFSNTRGGLIIVGVEEDPSNGKPKKWVGVTDSGKIVDRVHQYAALVTPVPVYEAVTTDEKSGKVFLLIRILEGDQTPYYAQNDANLWVRTGSISNPIDIASPDAAELLFGKKEKARLARSNYKSRVNEIYMAAIRRAERERKEAIGKEQQEHERFQRKIGENKPFRSQITDKEIGTGVGMFSVLIQPFFPHKALATPQVIKNKLLELRVPGMNFIEFPSLELEGMPEGVMMFEWRQDGFIRNGQFFANGTIYHTQDVVRQDQETKKPVVALYHAGFVLYQTLLFARNYYQYLGYQGSVEGEASIANIPEHVIRPIRASAFDFYPGFRESLLPSYRWEISTDTVVLGNELATLQYFKEKMDEIYWAFGYGSLDERLLVTFLKENGFAVPAEIEEKALQPIR